MDTLQRFMEEMKKLTFAELEMVAGGDNAAAVAYLRELRKKYGGRFPLRLCQELQRKKSII